MSNTSEVSKHSDEISNSELVRKSQLGDKAAFEISSLELLASDILLIIY